MSKRLWTSLLSLCLALVLAVSTAALDLREVSGFYLKQQTYSTCTLASSAMMLRRRAYLDGLSDWDSITESSLGRVAWSYVGLSHNFTMKGITVLHGTLPGKKSAEAELQELLKEHPEGIVAYDRTKPHAVLLTDYTDGQFYCADPSPAVSGGRIPVTLCTITLSKVTTYWYVAADANGAGPNLALSAREVTYPAKLKAGTGFSLSGTIGSFGTVTDVTVSVQTSGGKTVLQSSVQPNRSSFDVSKLTPDFASLPIGSYTLFLTADDDRGGHLRLKKDLLISSAPTVSAVYSGTVPTLSGINAVNLTETGFTVEAVAQDADGSVATVLFSPWADGKQFQQPLLGQRAKLATGSTGKKAAANTNKDTYTANISANAARLGISSFMVNITALDADGNFSRAALLVQVVADTDENGVVTDITADQLVL